MFEALRGMFHDKTKYDQGVPRSPLWPKVRAEWLVKNGRCAACGTKDDLNVHHVIPVSFDSKLELDTTNFLTLCEKPGHDCHFRLGHDCNWSKRNPNVRVDAAKSIDMFLSVQTRDQYKGI